MNKKDTFLRRWLRGEVEFSALLAEPVYPTPEEAVPYEPKENKHVAIRTLRRSRTGYRTAVTVLCIVFALFMLLVIGNLPQYGAADAPTVNEVPQRYVEQGMEETGAVNSVAGMILDYRAFDTLGESHVLFIAVCSVLILLKLTSGADGKPTQEQLEAEANDHVFEPKNDLILQKVANLLVPASLLFGIYNVLNGHLSPGGGFSGGAIMGAALILYLNAYGFKKTSRFFNFTVFRVVSYCALTFYALSKAYSFFTGANHLESIITTGNPGDILSAGLILPLNIAVGLVVSCTMYGIYSLFRRGRI